MKALIISGLMVVATMLQAQSVVPKVDGRNIPFEVFSSFKMPGTELVIELPNKTARYKVLLNGADKATFEDGVYSFNVPTARGLHKVEIFQGNKKILYLHLFVMTSIERMEDGVLNGYRIGKYPRPLGDGQRFRRPKGFIELTNDMLETQVSPNFKLKQFVPKQPGDPKYMILRESLLLKLEHLLAEINKTSKDKVKTFKITQAFMTPFANAEAGKAVYSRHPYGDAVTFIVDKDGNNQMDDLNGDGVLDMKDTRWLYDLVDEMFSRSDLTNLEGGLAHFKQPKRKTGFLYLDSRGRKVRF